MINKYRSLIWLRTQQLFSNSQLLIMAALPYIMGMLYTYLESESQLGKNLNLLNVLAMALGMTLGTMVSMNVAEEKEKNNIKELRLAGVNGFQYILSILFYPFILVLINILVLPTLVGAHNYTHDYVSYGLVIFLTGSVIAFINILIALNCRSVSQTQAISLPLMMLTFLLPVLSLIDPKLDKWVTYSFMGGFSKVFDVNVNVLTTSSFYALLVWFVILLIITIRNIDKKLI